MFELRPYQAEAVAANLDFFRSGKGNGIDILPTGSGKSLVIAATADGLGEPLMVLQPSKEILEQNIDKLRAYGRCPAVFSASLRKKQIAPITLATVGSVFRKPELFSEFKHMMIDECHLVNPQGGMYDNFIRTTGAKVIGLTATPYRLVSYSGYGSELKFLTRTRPRIFNEVIYYKQNGDLFRDGYLCPLEYHPIKCLNVEDLELNSTGADYTERSMLRAFAKVKMQEKVASLCERFLRSDRRGMLVFTAFTKDAKYVVDRVPGCEMVTDKTPRRERERLIEDFKLGRIRVLLNVGIFIVGFDYPALDTVMLAAPSMSLARYYQEVGRVIRTSPGKASALVIDLCGNYRRFGKVEDLVINENGGRWIITSNGRQLTNLAFDKYRMVA